jgi:hypothetical protein
MSSLPLRNRAFSASSLLLYWTVNQECSRPSALAPRITSTTCRGEGAGGCIRVRQSDQCCIRGTAGICCILHNKGVALLAAWHMQGLRNHKEPEWLHTYRVQIIQPTLPACEKKCMMSASVALKGMLRAMMVAYGSRTMSVRPALSSHRHVGYKAAAHNCGPSQVAGPCCTCIMHSTTDVLTTA